MSWIAITSADLVDRKVAALVTALKSAALGSGQADPTSEVISSVVATIRSNVSSCAGNELDIDPTKIPADLKDLACRMVIRAMQSRLRMQLNDDERAERDADAKTLERIARCELRVAKSDNPETAPSVQSGGGITVATKRTRQATGQTLRGL